MYAIKIMKLLLSLPMVHLQNQFILRHS